MSIDNHRYREYRLGFADRFTNNLISYPVGEKQIIFRMANKHVNAVIVGSGAGGGVTAKELAVAGLSVVLFERGTGQGMMNIIMMSLPPSERFPLAATTAR
jgi:hypothetical protein